MEVYHNNKKINDQEDRDTIIYQKGIEAGINHQHSSPETLEQFKKMGEDIIQLKVTQARQEEKLDSILSISKENSTVLKEHITDEVLYRKEQESKFNTKADKKEVQGIQDNLNRIVWIVLIAVLGAVISLVIRK